MILKAEAVTKKYFRKSSESNFFYAVSETTLELREGSITEITGRSGSGKSTLLNMLAGLLRPSSGRVLLGETDIYSLKDKELSRLRNSSIGVIPQGQTGLDSLTVIENVILPSVLYKVSLNSEERAMELLEKVGIAQLAHSYPKELSGGELRRLAIARALINSPAVLLADEPTGDLDDENTKLVLGILRNFADDGVSVLLVTHEAEAEKYADVVYRMNAGKPDQIKGRPG